MSNAIRFLDPKYRLIVDRFTAFSPTDVDGLSRRLDAYIFQNREPNENTPALHYELDEERVWVTLREDLTESQRRFFLSKALAAFMLRFRMPVSSETLIDIATEIILPERLVSEYCALNRCDPKYHPLIATHFLVPLPALELRLKQLGLYNKENDRESAET